MNVWPGKEFFEEAVVDLSKEGPARRAFARKMEQALIDEDLARWGKLSSQEPSAAFDCCSEPAQSSRSGMRERRIPAQQLILKDASFAFDAGLVWACSAGAKLEEEPLQDMWRDYLLPLLGARVDLRRHGLAFTCGALQAPGAPKAFQKELWEAGVDSHWTRREFGAAELMIWGQAWDRQAVEGGKRERWCADVLIQALFRHWEGACGEAARMFDHARGLGAPSLGWLSQAQSEAGHMLEQENNLFRSAMENKRSIMAARQLASAELDLRQEQWELMAARLCAQGPDCWARQALAGTLSASLQSILEKACLDAAAMEPGKSAQAPRL